MSDLAFFLTSLGSGLFSTLLCFFILSVRLKPAPPSLPFPSDILSEPRIFEFENGYLHKHSGGAGLLLPAPLDRRTAWTALSMALTSMIPGAEGAMAALRDKGHGFCLTGKLGEDAFSLVGNKIGARLHITLAATNPETRSVRIDAEALSSLQQEMEALRQASENGKTLIWTVDARGRITWANGIYRATLSRLKGKKAAQAWPIPPLFAGEDFMSPGTARKLLPHNDNGRSEGVWYDVTVTPMGEGEFCVHAVSLEKMVQTETKMRDFIQTLTKSFAHLPTGLAIFDRDGQLVLFNPALIDLTELNTSLLTTRPSLQAFFQHIRETRRLAPLSNSKDWRQKLAAVQGEQAVPFCETWALGSGGTYQVTLRPQGDGSVVLLMDDITEQQQRSSEHRAARDQMQAVFDLSTEAGAICAPSGEIEQTNAAYRDLWQIEGDTPQSLGAELNRWRSFCDPSPLWQDVRDFVGQSVERASWQGEIMFRAGTAVEVRVAPLPEGRTFIGFSPLALPLMPPVHAVAAQAGALR